MSRQEVDLKELQVRLAKLRGDPAQMPDITVVIPVNVQADLENVLQIVSDIARYSGIHAVEVLLVLNNYAPDEPPVEIEAYRHLGLHVVAIPDIRRTGQQTAFAARMPGVRAAPSEPVVLFDADCRVPNPTALLDWYVAQFRGGAQAAYTHVGYFELKKGNWIRVRMAVHHAARWWKRNVLRIPTLRGSNYAIRRSLMLNLYDDGWLVDDMNVGPTLKSLHTPIAYSDAKELTVLTSGRKFNNSGLVRLVRYFRYRLRYNLRVLPVRKSSVTHRVGVSR